MPGKVIAVPHPNGTMHHITLPDDADLRDQNFLADFYGALSDAGYTFDDTKVSEAAAAIPTTIEKRRYDAATKKISKFGV